MKKEEYRKLRRTPTPSTANPVIDEADAEGIWKIYRQMMSVKEMDGMNGWVKMEKIVSRGIRMVAESADAQMKANVKLWKKEMAEHPTWKGMLRDLMKCKDELAKAEEDLTAIREEKAYNDYNTWYYGVRLINNGMEIEIEKTKNYGLRIWKDWTRGRRIKQMQEERGEIHSSLIECLKKKAELKDSIKEIIRKIERLKSDVETVESKKKESEMRVEEADSELGAAQRVFYRTRKAYDMMIKKAVKYIGARRVLELMKEHPRYGKAPK